MRVELEQRALNKIVTLRDINLLEFNLSFVCCELQLQLQALPMNTTDYTTPQVRKEPKDPYRRYNTKERKVNNFVLFCPLFQSKDEESEDMGRVSEHIRADVSLFDFQE